MPLAPRMIISFGDCDIDVERRELRRANTAMNVEPQVFDLLVYLERNGDRVLSKDEIFASVCEQLASTAWSAGTTAAVLHYVRRRPDLHSPSGDLSRSAASRHSVVDRI
jgi:DNA-binding response OmpR family regulator